MRQSFSYTLLITWVLIIFSCKSSVELTSVKANNISITEDINPPDSQLIAIYLPYKTILEKDMSRVISYAETSMLRAKPESNLTNFLADLILEEGIKEAQNLNSDFQPVISFFNYEGIRSALPKGDITVGNIFELMPFENELVFVKFSGKQVKTFLDIMAENGGNSLGGVRFTISKNRANKIIIQGNNLEPENYYWMATNDYIADGGDGMDIFLEKMDYIKSGKKIRDIIISNLENRQKNEEKLNVKTDGRIKIE